MDLAAPEIGIFISLIVILAVGLIALAADLLKGNMETLREDNIRLRSREVVLSGAEPAPAATQSALSPPEPAATEPDAEPAPAGTQQSLELHGGAIQLRLVYTTDEAGEEPPRPGSPGQRPER